MATEKQIAANRQNASSSTGPRTEQGKRRSRRNAIRHGLTAETVIDVLEDPAAYKSLQRAIYADYRPRTNFELELVARLVSLLWRLRRAVAIESGLMVIHARLSHKGCTAKANVTRDALGQFYDLIPALAPRSHTLSNQAACALSTSQEEPASGPDKPTVLSEIVRSFMNVCSREGEVFERLGRYEMQIWRQVVQTILLLNSISRSSHRHAGCDERTFHLRFAKQRHLSWPPFAASDSNN